MTALLLAMTLMGQIEVVDHTKSTTSITVTDHCAPRGGLQVVDHTVPKATRANRGYPIRTAGKWWYHNGYWPQAIHLNEGEHLGLFDVRWLAGLSPQDLLNLHSDAHEGRINWNYAIRPGEYQAPEVTKAPSQRWVQRCINGRCYLMLE